ncbi:MAG: sulfite exporter TauE/SafE family protein [Pseudomonadota bacterium]
MVFDITFFALAIPAVMFAGISKAGFGSGASFAAAPLMAMVVDPAVSIGILLPLFMAVDAVTLRPYWRRWDWQATLPVLIGGLPGVAMGALFFQQANPDTLRIFLGGIALAFVVWQSLRYIGLMHFKGRTFGRITGLITGVAAGFTSFISHAGGPPVAIYMLSVGVGKTTYQASSVLIFWAINIYKAVPYTFLGIFTSQTLLADLYLLPFALLGAWIGVKAHFLIPERPFFAVTYGMLLITGVKLIYDGIV